MRCCLGLDFPATLLQVSKETLEEKLLSRIMESKWGKQSEIITVANNVQQAESTRDALAKGLYTRIFDYLVTVSTKTKYHVVMMDWVPESWVSGFG